MEVLERQIHVDKDLEIKKKAQERLHEIFREQSRLKVHAKQRNVERQKRKEEYKK